MLIAGRSFRTSRLAEMPRWGVEGSTISGELVRGDGSAGRRVVRRTLTKREDDRWQNAGESVEWARVIAFGWQDLEIINGAPGARRNFIDGFAGRLYPTHLAALVRYRQILARRNRLLQQHLVALVLRLAEVLPVAEAAGTAPVLLLDDALSELDPGVRELVLRELGAAEQVFLTSPETLAVKGAAVFQVNAGGIAPV